MQPGIHLVHKPIGATSFSIVQKFQAGARANPSRRPPRICHGGALDPFSSGLLLILVEPATKLFDYLHDIPKIYETNIRWGVETDNGDPLGKVIFEGDASSITPDRLEEAIRTFQGWRDQVPPATSNKRIDGERAYEKAHRGEVVTLPSSKVYMHEATWISHNLPHESRLRISVRGGYYVRSLARDLGRLLGCGAHLTQLNRTAIGPHLDPGVGKTLALAGRDLLPWLPIRHLQANEAAELRQSRPIPAGTIDNPDWPAPAGFPVDTTKVRGFLDDRFAFLLDRAGDQLSPVISFRAGI